MLKRCLSIALALAGMGATAFPEPLPKSAAALIREHCLECHDQETQKGGVNLEVSHIPWASVEERTFWERAMAAVAEKRMPPENRDQPTDEERDRFTAWLDQQLTAYSLRGGTVARRLNREEYYNSVKFILGMHFDMPPGFPADPEAHGFDNVAESLQLSPTLMDAYAETAFAIADKVFPRPLPKVEPKAYEVAADEMAISYSSGSVRDGALRLVSSSANIMRSSTWPNKVEIKASGTYKVVFQASAFRPKEGEPPLLQVYARDLISNDAITVRMLRLLGETEVAAESPATYEFDATLYAGQTIVFHYANADLNSDPDKKDQLIDSFRKRFEADPRYLAAWLQVARGKSQTFRGGVGWERLKKLMADESLQADQVAIDSGETRALLERIGEDPVLFVETAAYEHFETGPGLDIHSAVIRGPFQRVDGPAEKMRKRFQINFFGARNQRSDREWNQAILDRLLNYAFRRPVEKETVDAFNDLISGHRAQGHTREQGFHLALRTVLMSPRFLYRSLKPGRLDAHDLATRLSYFLTSNPPDYELRQLADSGKLNDPAVLRKEAERLLPTTPDASMIQRFTGQWLDTRALADIMPDPRLNFTDADADAAKQEVERFFLEMLQTNRPMTDFIDPDFTYTTASIAKKIYGLEEGFDPATNIIQRITLSRGGRYGGVLGQAAVLMATANGVDTQPVIRGVWALENILGDPPPPPPEAVPAITPDTAGATTTRELLKAHMADPDCARCHRKIDPVGFALENFDAVGRWRTHYPVYGRDDQGRETVKQGARIDSSGQLPDGTPIKDIVDLKLWVVEHIDRFSNCLAEKLLVYATGRIPTYVERKEIARIVKANRENGNGFRDLILALIDSVTFRTK